MKVLVFGAGALGSLVGALLSRVHDVTLVGRHDHVDAIRGRGLSVTGNAELTVRVKAQESVTPGLHPDLVLLTVKSFDTATALEALAPAMGPDTTLLSVQNGLGNLELAQARFPDRLVLASAVMVGAALEAPGRVSWNGPGEIIIGASAKEETEARVVAVAFAAAGMQARAVPDIRPALWRKAVVNAAINPLSAIARVPNGRLLEDAQLHARLVSAAREAASVARAEGVNLPEDEAVALVERVTKQTAGNRSSMLQDVERGRRTEIDAINGRILAAARRRGLACPTNERLFAEVKALEPKGAA
ncbi:MAG: 2-dehydropantoate 2-reductase [Euryarchaeota archaeon]|nr:2-dehydropantoate 2-reductase [Euryarchaeota archaeon]